MFTFDFFDKSQSLISFLSKAISSITLPSSRFRSQDVQNELSMLSSAQRVSEILNSRLRENIESSLRNLSNNNTNSNNSNMATVQPSIPSTPVSNENNVAVITLPTDFEQLNREVIMEEISDLVHRQLGNALIIFLIRNVKILLKTHHSKCQIPFNPNLDKY